MSTSFRNYKENLQVAVISTVDWAESNFAIDYSKISVMGCSGNSKEDALIKIIDKNEDKIRWCRVVEKTMEHYQFEKDKLNFIETYFFNGKSVEYTCIAVGICRTTFFNWENEILEMACNWAKELRLV